MTRPYDLLVTGGDVYLEGLGVSEVDLLVRDGRIAGAVTLYPHSDGAQPDAYFVKGLAVRPSERGNGVATALLEWCKERARNAGRVRLVVTTTPEMGHARALYTKHGFVRDARLDDKPLPGVTATGYVMEL